MIENVFVQLTESGGDGDHDIIERDTALVIGPPKSAEPTFAISFERRGLTWSPHRAHTKKARIEVCRPLRGVLARTSGGQHNHPTLAIPCPSVPPQSSVTDALPYCRQSFLLAAHEGERRCCKPLR